MTNAECVFCRLGRSLHAASHGDVGDAFEMVPLHPVTAGHLLVVPYRHVRDALDEPELTGKVMEYAARRASGQGECNIITSVGPAATQSVFHLHVHIVPRREGDRLALPWSTQP